MSDTIARLAVVGAGTMGRGIAQVAAQAGLEVALWDLSGEARGRARRELEASLGAAVTRGKLSAVERDAALARLAFPETRGEAVRQADLVVEAVVEDLALKQRLFAELEREAPARAILASNTSSLPLGKIAAGLARPGQVLGMHFFNPVPAMALVELVVHAGTDDATREAALAVTARLGKTPIVVKDSPGFATSRLGIVLGLEAMRMLEQGVASAEDIDRAMELGYRHPMGPLKLTDLVGLDVRLAIADFLFTELGGDQYRAPELLRRKVAAGELGKKTGRGFHSWNEVAAKKSS
ncbi:MAG: 3-hydroxyacyl-CoA dehydrogenase family protein [Deltaproteobacteria bacterium]|nr:3-hydroxyacyl-CoA dehydrogenase family protein [Deltaproteobacteria bacterium]